MFERKQRKQRKPNDEAQALFDKIIEEAASQRDEIYSEADRNISEYRAEAKLARDIIKEYQEVDSKNQGVLAKALADNQNIINILYKKPKKEWDIRAGVRVGNGPGVTVQATYGRTAHFFTYGEKPIPTKHANNTAFEGQLEIERQTK